MYSITPAACDCLFTLLLLPFIPPLSFYRNSSTLLLPLLYIPWPSRLTQPHWKWAIQKAIVLFYISQVSVISTWHGSVWDGMLGPAFHGYHWGSWTQCVKDLHAYMARITDMCGCVHLCVCMWVCVCASLCVHVCICGNVCVCLWTHMWIFACMWETDVSPTWHAYIDMTQAACLQELSQHVYC